MTRPKSSRLRPALASPFRLPKESLEAAKISYNLAKLTATLLQEHYAKEYVSNPVWKSTSRPTVNAKII
jgi:hypothetical protein